MSTNPDTTEPVYDNLSEQTLRIVEIFGPTVQGEGPSVGRAAIFLRLGGCHLSCVWCDTAFSWDPTRPDPQRPQIPLTVDEAVARLTALSRTVRHLVITGGEPLLQREAVTELSTRLRDRHWTLEIETSGTIVPGPLTTLIDQFNVSPKLAHSGVDDRARTRLDALNEFAANPRAIFKFVVRESSDLAEIEALLQQITPSIEPRRVFVMAEGTDAQTVLERSRTLVDDVVSQGWGLTPRWHSLLWGDERGR